MFAGLLISAVIWTVPIIGSVSTDKLPTPSFVAAIREGSCTDKTLFGLPTWYKYLDIKEAKSATGDVIGCDVQADFTKASGELDGSILMKIALGIVDILLRLAALIAVGFVLFGGFKLLSSQGESKGLTESRQTIINALVGLVITLVATGIVTFIGNTLG